jgi:hypothetical protein
MEATFSFTTSVHLQGTTWCYIPEDRTLHNHRCLKFWVWLYLYVRSILGVVEESNNFIRQCWFWNPEMKLKLSGSLQRTIDCLTLEHVETWTHTYKPYDYICDDLSKNIHRFLRTKRLWEVINVNVMTYSKKHSSKNYIFLINCSINIYPSVTLQPLWAVGSFFSCLTYTESVGILGRVISPSQGLYQVTEQCTHGINVHICML